MFDTEITEAIKNHAIAEWPKESVGLVLENKKTGVIKYQPVDNISTNPEEEFQVDKKDMVKYQRSNKIKALMHSHPLIQGRDSLTALLAPSQADMETQKAMNIAFGIVVSGEETCSNPIYWGGETPVPGLYGRPFLHGIQDCYSFIRDYYRTELDILLPEYPRRDNWWEPERDEDGNPITEQEDLYSQNFQDAGFEFIGSLPNAIDQIQEHDVVLMKIRSRVPNHGGVYLGGDHFGHHLAGTFSKNETGIMRHEKLLHSLLRHKSFIKE